MTRDDLLRKIRGLLAIASRSNYEAEAATALAAAQRMMLEHSLSQDDLAQAERFGSSHFGHTFVRRPAEDSSISDILQKFFFVRCGWSSQFDAATGEHKRIRHIFGAEHHRAIAEFVWSFLSRTFRALWMARRKTLARNSGKQSIYYESLADGLCQRLAENQQQHCPGLFGLIRDHHHVLTTELRRQIPEARDVSTRARSRNHCDLADLIAARDGLLRGRAISIPVALRGPSDAESGLPRPLLVIEGPA